MEDKKSSKAIGVQWFIPVVPCGSQLNYSMRSCAFQATRSPEVPNLSFRLLLFKHKALLSSASLYSPLSAAFCASSQALCSISDALCSLLLLPSFPLAWSQLHPFQTGSPFPQNSSLNTACCCSAPAITSWRSPVSVHHPLSSHALRSLLLLFPCSDSSFCKWVCVHNYGS